MCLPYLCLINYYNLALYECGDDQLYVSAVVGIPIAVYRAQTVADQVC